MFKKFMILLITGVVWGFTVLAQVPQAFKFQAIARDNSGNILGNQSISFRISILQGSPSGPAVYVETHATATNQFGLANLEIGHGNVQSGVFSAINWALANYYVLVELDAAGGSNFSPIGTTELLSVPYAFYALGSSSGLVPGTGLSLNGNVLNSVWTENSGAIFNNNSGNVGIGSSQPAAKLDVQGSVRIADGTQGSGKILTSDGSGFASWTSPSVVSGVTGTCATPNYLSKWSSSSAIGCSGIYEDASGNVGIGTTAPTAKLVVAGQIRITGGSPGAGKILTSDASGTASWIAPGTVTGVTGTCSTIGYHARWTGSSTLGCSNLFESSYGYVGIGTTNPTAMLEVNGQVKITGGSPAAGKVLTSDVNGLGSWQTPVITGGGTANYAAYWTSSGVLGGEQYLALSRGGTNNNITPVGGAVVYSDSYKLLLTATGTAGQVLRSNGAGAPYWAEPGGLYTGGTGITISGNVINSVWTQVGNDIHNNNTGKVLVGTSTYPTAPPNSAPYQLVVGNGEIRIMTSDTTMIGFRDVGVSTNRHGVEVINNNANASVGGMYNFPGYSSVYHKRATDAGLHFTAGAYGNWNSWTPMLSITQYGNVGIGTTAPTARLEVSGIVKATSFVATLSGTGAYKYNTTLDMIVPDYVFDSYFDHQSGENPSYEMLSLEGLKNYVETHRHLPGVPSSREITAAGAVNLQGLSMVTLEKVEELTLYLIELKAQNDSLKNELHQLKKEVRNLSGK